MTNSLSSLSGWEEIGRGGFATVYRARQAHMARQVAVKILSTGDLDDDQARRFRNECQTMGALGAHPNIVSVFDAGTTEVGHPYLVMEFVPGGSLAERGVGALSVDVVLDVGVQVAGALETAHRSGVLHRDVKPANILRGAAGSHLLTDFGIASLQGGTQTQTGLMVGTVAYLAPEIINGERATPLSDVYALGTTLHTLLTGVEPFRRSTDEAPAAAMRRILEGDSVRIRDFGVTEPVAAVVERAMAVDPSDRYPSAAEFGEALIAAQRALGLDPSRLVVLDLGVVGTEAAAGVAATVVSRQSAPVSSPQATTPAASMGVGAQHRETTAVPSSEPDRRRSSAALWVTAAFALIVVAAAVIFVLGRGGDDSTAGATTSVGGTDAFNESSIPDVTTTLAPTTTTATTTTTPTTTTPTTTTPTTTTPTTTTPTTTTPTTTTPPTVAAGVPFDSDVALARFEEYLETTTARRYEDAWSMLSAQYQIKYLGFENFVDFWETVEGAGIYSVSVVADSHQSATLRLEVWYGRRVDGSRSEELVEVDLAPDASSGRVVITDYRFLGSL